MKVKVIALLVLLVISMRVSTAQEDESEFRIVGYFSLRAALNADVEIVPFSQLTHINLAFLNPDSLGRFTPDLSSLEPFISAAHSQGTKVLFAIGGGSSHPQYHDLLKDDKRSDFINTLVAQVLENDVDGIDVDLEGGDIDENYETFVTELADKLKMHDKLITSAIAVYYKDQLSDAALDAYDFVNIMVYDRTGPWRPEKPGPHSTFTHAVQDLRYFSDVRNIASERMVLGVPFYGYGFAYDSTTSVVTMNFDEITTTFPGSEWVDEWELPDGKIIYYNGIPTIKQKTALAREKASGIMIWQVLGDADGSKSLLKAINDVVNEEE